MKDYDQLFQSALIDVEKSDSEESLENVRVKYFGKNGLINSELKNISKLTTEQKKQVGKKLNIFKSTFHDSIKKKKEIVNLRLVEEKLKSEFIDFTLPTRDAKELDAKIHPISFTIKEIYQILSNMGSNPFLASRTNTQH